MEISKNTVKKFQEKPKGDKGWVNGGFFIFEQQILDYIKNDDSILEQEPLQKLAVEKNLASYKHDGFWQPMDTLRDKHYLEELWNSKRAPWKIW
jgi:glucose-1-phosphate cytidylyltransferase